MTTGGTSLEGERRQEVVAEGQFLLTDKETNATMAAAIKGFENYIKYLATGKLDGYLDSTRREDKLTDLEVKLPLNPILLLHDLGNHPDKGRIEKLFIRNTVHLFGVSGSGKTRLALEGLCLNWGLYISCISTRGSASGSKDFEVATEEMLPTLGTLPSLSFWSGATDRVSAMLLCARIFILKQFVQHIPVNTDATLARRRWVLAQVLPPHLDFWGDDLFVRVLRTLQHADMQIIELKTKRKDLFPDGRDTSLFVVIDEVQVAADNLKEYSNTGTDMHPILRKIFFTGFILSGTGLSMNMVDDVGTAFAKCVPFSGLGVFTDIGRFTKDGSSQLDYICRHLTLSDNDSDRQLLERMMYWFSGRHRLTASLIELFICLENIPRHRVLTSFVEHLTGFKITDAIELEDGEPPISPELSVLISNHQPINELDRIFNKKNREELIQCLVEILRQWTLGSEPTAITIENHMHDMIAWGLGARNASSLGYIFEEAILLMLMDTFGGKYKPLSHAFHCSESLGSRMVTLVTLKHGADDTMQCYPVSWKTGNSDRLGLKASSPENILTFLHNPDGKPFLLPNTHMGPDVLCTLQDKETKELIILAVQAKVLPTLNAQKWRDAIISVTPKFFYMLEKGGKPDRYAQVPYPNLIDDLTASLEMVLGPAVYTPIADIYRSKLHSSIQAQQQSVSHSMRQTPRFLRIIATPDNEQQKNLKGEWKGDVAVLRWDVGTLYEFNGRTTEGHSAPFQSK
ncbi:hypothetical protein BU17DRAFT_64682 [Hysterangium stoloniferum]|nr:hypothetical protein BU17DRAFT_64682 [Hysterangium stoloniferum]